MAEQGLPELAAKTRDLTEMSRQDVEAQLKVHRTNIQHRLQVLSRALSLSLARSLSTLGLR